MRCPLIPPTEELPTETIAEVATILAKGYLKYRQTLPVPAISDQDSDAQKDLASSAEPERL